jgi:hypothetical protein
MVDQFLAWMFQPGTYNDMVVYLGLFLLVMIAGMVYCNE